MRKLSVINTKRVSRSISMENITGEKGRGGMATEGSNKPFLGELGQGWKVSPCVFIKPHEEFVCADIKGMGEVLHIWMTLEERFLPKLTLKVFYDNSSEPSICCPLGKFFCVGHDQRTLVTSLMVNVNPGIGLNSFWSMPFRKGFKLSVTNDNDEPSVLYYQVDYELGRVARNQGYLHCFYSESKPVEKYKNHVILPEIAAKGTYVGCFMTYETDFTTWWGEGEIKFFIDGDKEFPTICGTGTEDYFLGAWNFEYPKGTYKKFSGPYSGLVEVIPEGEIGIKNQKFSMYRWHINDPIRFNKDLRVEIQSIGWDKQYKYYRLNEANISTLCFIYLNKVKGVN